MTPIEFGVKLAKLTDPASLQRVQHAMGGAAKEAATKAVIHDLGADMRMSNLRGQAKLSSGYDLEPDGVLVHLRPAGLWKLADAGRRRSGTIYPHKGHRAVRTPHGFRAWSRYRPSRGLGTIDDAVSEMKKTVPVAADKAVAEIASGI